MFAYWLNLWALPRSGPTLIALYTYVQPIVAAILGGPMIGERVSPHQGLAAALVFLGVYLASSRSRSERLPEPEPEPA
jgi:drug/metabolite transporter (DMT)-like permease